MRWKDLELHPEPHTMKRASSFSASISVSWGSVKNALLVLGPVMPRVSAICWSMIRLSISHQPGSSQSVKSFKIPFKIFKILSGIAWIYSAKFSLKEPEPRVKFWSCQNSVLHELFLSFSRGIAPNHLKEMVEKGHPIKTLSLVQRLIYRFHWFSPFPVFPAP